MNKSEVIKSLRTALKKKGMHYELKEVSAIHDTVFEDLGKILADGHEVSILNFGTFRSIYSTMRDMSKCIKEDVHATVQVFVLKFKTSTFLKERLNGKKTR